MSKPPAILLNDDFYSKGRNIRWIKENGAEAVLILQCVWIASGKEGDFKISKEDVIHIPFLSTYPNEKIYQVLEAAVLVGLLNGDATHYWNSQVIENTKNYLHKQNNYSEAARKREENKRLAGLCQNSTKIVAEPLNINNKSKLKSKDPVWDETIGKMVRVIK